ncbi:MAG TPA: PLP-dependent aspartate aminotransferase family protein [Bacteroidales bacterium]|nr:PLP-dependent aspartate aminotransferase family protein [Bacteroidales bacterium]
MDTKNKGFDTRQIHAGDFEDQFGSAVAPIYQTSTFAFKDADHGARLFKGDDSGYIYTRLANPTIEALENKLAALENGVGGIALASGMAAVSTVYTALLEQGDHMISTHAVYGPSRILMETIFSKFGVESTYMDTSNPKDVEAAIKENTKLIFLETPANPTMELSDIKAISDIAHKHDIPVVVDNTFSSPYLQQPLDLGADIALHSLTKFINGHADIVGGALIAKDEDMLKKLQVTMRFMGGNMDPHQAYMVYRGVKTLSLRVQKATDNAKLVAEYLDNHPKIKWVNYPGLKSHPQHELASKQMKDFGAMLCFEVEGGFNAGKTLMNNVQIALLAVSLGGVESLIQHPASMTHAGVSEESRMKAGITPGLVRFSVGIENAEDIIDDLKQALDKI